MILSDDQKSLQELAHKFAINEVKPLADLEHESPDPEKIRSLMRKMGEAGFMSVQVPEADGGMGLGGVEFALIIEELAKVSVSQIVTLAVSTLPLNILLNFGNSDQKSEWVPKLMNGECIGAFALSEADSGSDAASLKCKATKTENGYVLNGTKLWISNAPYAGVFVVMARTGDDSPNGISSFLVEAGTPGLKISKNEKKMGLNGSLTSEIVFENCEIPSSNLIGKEGEGFKIALSTLDSGRINIGAAACGLGQAALDYATEFSQERKQFNKSIFDFQGIQWMLAEHQTELSAARLLVYEAAQRKDLKLPYTLWASMAKLKATDTTMALTTDAVQILGGVGYTKEYPVERYMRDAKVLQIVEGTNQIQKVIIARTLKNS
jgi:acyl-CoA dehydrogenase